MNEFPEYKTASVESLIPYARNSRTHSDEQVAKIAASIREFGFLNPVIVDGNSGIVAGHGRILAAQRLGMATVPVIEAAHLTDAQKRAYVIADNRLALDSEWDEDLLRIEIFDLQDSGFDLSLTGFTLDEISDFDFDAGEHVELPELPTGEKSALQQKTFTLHNEQAAIIDSAIALARSNPLADTGLNDNSNGNALALICEQWLSGMESSDG